MGIKVNVGLAKKIGQPDYGSLGATCNVEFELDGGFDNGSSERFHDTVRRAYGACRQAVESEIATNQNGNVSNGVGGQHSSSGAVVNRVANHNSSNPSGSTGSVRAATSSQVRAIHAIANRNGADLPGLLQTQFGAGRPDELSIRDASGLIDQLKGSGNGTPNTVSR
jgi:hypothetical protein